MPCEKQLNSPPHAEGRAWLALGLQSAVPWWGGWAGEAGGATVSPGKELCKTMPQGSYFV